jgi:hypothetical protein
MKKHTDERLRQLIHKQRQALKRFRRGSYAQAEARKQLRRLEQQLDLPPDRRGYHTRYSG